MQGPTVSTTVSTLQLQVRAAPSRRVPHGEHLQGLVADPVIEVVPRPPEEHAPNACLLYTSDAADE